MALCLSVKPPDEPAMRIGRFDDDTVPLDVPLTACPFVRTLFDGRELILIDAAAACFHSRCRAWKRGKVQWLRYKRLDHLKSDSNFHLQHILLELS